MAGLNKLISLSPIGITILTGLTLLFLFHPIIGGIAFILAYFIADAREHYGVLEKSGVPVVPPTLFRGSEPNLHKTVLHLEDIKRYNKYGGIWGSYVGKSPQIFVADPELIRLMYVKDFVHFGDRQEPHLGTPMLDEIMDFAPGEKWATLRKLLSPLFTTLKLKQSSEVIANSAEEFVEDLKKECVDGRIKIDSKHRLTAWLIDMFSQATLGVCIEDRKNPENKFANAFREMMAENTQYDWMFSLALSFPILRRFNPTFNDEPTKLIESTIRQVMELRKKTGVKNSKDFLDVLCDLMDRVPSNEFKDLGISQTTVLAQAFNMFLGGYETSATTLSHLFYYMANYPEIQDKMYSELCSALEENGGKINYDLIKDKIPYITSCISECLRLAPTLGRPERICTKDWNYNYKGRELAIKKGTVLMLASWAANRNPEVYEDPEQFNPERFLPENKKDLDPFAFSSFGFGPRNCIGMRFGYDTLKLAACHFVKNFRVVKRNDTKIEYKPGTLFVIQFKPIYVDLVKRN